MRVIAGAFACAFVAAVSVNLANGQATKATAEKADQVPKQPYAVEFKTTLVKTLADGSTEASESSELDAVDSHGRKMFSNITVSATGEKKTDVHTTDPVNHTLNYWSVPGTTAMVVNAPDVGEDTECSRKMKAISPLHPSGTQITPIEDLGTATMLGIAVHGGKVSFMPGIFRMGEGPHMRTNEVWTATDPALDGLTVRVVSDGGPAGRSTREVVKFTPGEPDASLFQMPAGRTITTREGRAFYCDVKPVAKPPAAPPAQSPPARLN
jgi:hypothetical protein